LIVADEPESKTWEDAFAALRNAAGELRDSVGRLGASDVDESVAREQLRHDVSRLEQSAATLLSKLGKDFETRREGVEAAFEKERAERSADQIKASLDELAAVAGTLANEVAASASDSLKQAEPEVKSALRDLDNVLNSAATWLRATVDPQRDQRGGLVSEAGRPPLDDF
jgi:multidrug resistance efflux pump